MSDTGTPIPRAPGFITGDRPQIVTSRFAYDDSHTLARYLATGGYEGLKAALAKSPAAVHEEVRTATILGRGGAGFPAGVKWGLTPQGVWPRYLVVNGDESEPGTYKDRLLMELDPHQLIEGCLIACYATGLSQCFLYIRGEMAVAQERVAAALNDAYAAGYIGKNILGSELSVDVVLAWGAGAYVVGEETALIESLEGNRGMPRLKPPFFPAAIGLYGQPTIVNNVETLSNLPWLMINGSAEYTAIGSEASPGTRMVAVSGHVKRPAVFEVVNGTTTFRDMIYGEEFCQGIRDGHELKAFIPGGGSATWFTPEQVDLPYENKVVGAAGSMTGSGAVMVMDETTDIPEAALSLARFYAHESCGKCVPCREGGTWLERILTRICAGYGAPEDLDLLFGVGESICPGRFPHAASTKLGLEAVPFPYKMTTICFVGPSAYAPIHSALTLFREEFEAKIKPRVRIPQGHGAPMSDHPSPAEAEHPEGAVEAQEPPAPPEPDPTAVEILIDGQAFTARKGELIIAAAERAGVYIPRFCWYNRMSSVGMCRMCLCEVDSGRGPQLTPTCMVTVAPDMKVDTQSETTKRTQEGILELLLANHPLDCPVCDKGGECPLQDQAFSHGPGESRYVEEKRHFEKPIPISDLVLLDRERCILCDRCTRFADEVAGDPLISFSQRGNQTQIATFPDEPFSSYFSGNTVQICPVGALTAVPYRFKARPWDLEEVESTCTTCSVGCRTVVQSSRDELVRYLGVDSDPVNWSWLCDRGRFNFEATNAADRLTAPLVRGEAGLAETSWSVAMDAAAQLVREALAGGGAGSIAMLGGARGTNEDAYAWALLCDAIGIVHRDAQIGDGLPATLLSLPRATIDEATTAATVVLLAPDLKEELPVLHLRLRHAAEQRKVRIVELTPAATGLSRHAWRSITIEPAAVGAVESALADHEVADQLRSGPVVVVAGRANLAESGEIAASALRTVLAACPGAKVLPALRRGNVVGAIQLGLTPQGDGLDGAGILTAAADGKVDLLVLLGADPLSDFPDADVARRALAGARRIIAVDTFLTESAAAADVVLAAAAYGEKAGTTTNLEGRVTTVGKKVSVAGTARPDWMIAVELAELLDHLDIADPLVSVDALTDAIAASVPAYSGATRAALVATPDGVLAVPEADPAALADHMARAGDRVSYDYRLVLTRKLYDRAVMTAHSPSLAGLAAPAAAHINPLDLDRMGITDGDEVRVVSARGTVVLPIAADERVRRGALQVPFNVPGASITDIVDATAPAVDVRLERL